MPLFHNTKSRGISPIRFDNGGIIPQNGIDPNGMMNGQVPNIASVNIQTPNIQKSGLGPPRAPAPMKNDTSGLMQYLENAGMKDSFSNAPHMDVGGIPGSTEMSPWYTRQDARDMTHESGPLLSAVPGRTDQLNKMVPAGAYVIPADVVSGIGEGNTLAGANILSKALSSGPHGVPMPRTGGHMGPPHAPGLPKNMKPFAKGGAQKSHVPVVLAGGEYVVHPDDVMKLGNGNMKKGHKILDAFVLHARKKTVKEMKNLPGPKK